MEIDRRMFVGGVLGLIGASPAYGSSPPSSSTAESGGGDIQPYLGRLQAALDDRGGGRFLPSTESDLFAAHQDARERQGLSGLNLHDGLSLAARAHAADQCERGFFGHVSPEGFGPVDRVGLMARTFVGLPGENVVEAMGYDGVVAAEWFMKRWMDSPGHRENVLRPSFTHIGVGVCQKWARTIAVAVFGQHFAELDRPLPLKMAAADLVQTVADAKTDMASFDLSVVGRNERQGPFDPARPVTAPSGVYTLRPRFRLGAQSIVVIGPIVELSA